MHQANDEKYITGQQPFFSVLLPTRNRPHLVAFALESLIKQDLGDFEVIVSDNADDDLICKGAVDRLSDSRIRYFRTSGELSMPDNWEFALSQAKGKYVTVLEDKQVYFPNTLSVVYEAIVLHQCESVCWHNDILDDTLDSPTLIHYLGSGNIFMNRSDDILRRLTENLNDWSKVPRMINSALSRESLSLIKAKYGLTRFFIDVTPDICAAIMQLAAIDKIAHIDRALCITGGVKLSNGRASLAKSNPALTSEFINKIGTSDMIYSHVELKGFLMPGNIVVNDYLRLRELLGGRLLVHQFSNMAYTRICLRDLIRSFSLGGAIEEESRTLAEYISGRFGKLDKLIIIAWGIRLFMNVTINRWLFRYPRIANVVYSIRGVNTRLYPDCQSILSIIDLQSVRPFIKEEKA